MAIDSTRIINPDIFNPYLETQKGKEDLERTKSAMQESYKIMKRCGKISFAFSITLLCLGVITILANRGSLPQGLRCLNFLGRYKWLGITLITLSSLIIVYTSLFIYISWDLNKINPKDRLKGEIAEKYSSVLLPGEYAVFMNGLKTVQITTSQSSIFLQKVYSIKRIDDFVKKYSKDYRFQVDQTTLMQRNL